MDAFFASIVQRDRPQLRGRPVLVGHDGPRGVVCAASYESRSFGCRSAMPMAEARRRCPDAIVVGVPGDRVREMSGRLFDLLAEFSPLVEPLSVDEAFVDLTGTERLLGEPAATADRIRRAIRDRLQLTGSVGLAPNKFLAKLASDQNKPDGLTVVRAEQVTAWLAAMPIGRMWGIGRVGEQRLGRFGIATVGDLQRADPHWMSQWFGSDAQRLADLARGVDDRPVIPDHQARSIGHEQTFGQDMTDPAMVRRILLDQVEQVGWRLRRKGLTAGRVTLKIRTPPFVTITRSRTLAASTDLTDELWRSAAALFDHWADRSFKAVRLIGMSAAQLARGPGQMGLFGEADRQRRHEVDAAMDAITNRFGKRAIRRGGTL